MQYLRSNLNVETLGKVRNFLIYSLQHVQIRSINTFLNTGNMNDILLNEKFICELLIHRNLILAIVLCFRTVELGCYNYNPNCNEVSPHTCEDGYYFLNNNTC